MSIAVAMTASIARSADYYVSTSGDDNQTGNRTQPWRTIQKAASSVKAGDTVHVEPGTYHEKIMVTASGSKEEGFITFKGGNKAQIHGGKTEGRDIFCIEDANYIRVEGFELTGLKANDGSGIRVLGSAKSIELVNNVIHDIRGEDAMAITIYGTHPKNSIRDLLIEGNLIYDCEPAMSETLTLNGNVEHFRIINNTVRDVNNIGICMIGGEDWINPDRTKVTRNGLCKGNKVLRAKSNYGGGYGAGIYVDGGKDIIVEDNEVSGCDLGIEIGAENKGTVASGIIVRNNLIWRNEKAGLVIGGFEEGVGRVKNCTLTGNYCFENDQHEDTNGELWIQWASENTITKNVFWAGKDGLVSQIHQGGIKGNVLDENTYYTAADKEDITFIWPQKNLNSFSDYQQESGLDKNSTFSLPAWHPKLPDNIKPAKE